MGAAGVCGIVRVTEGVAFAALSTGATVGVDATSDVAEAVAAGVAVLTAKDGGAILAVAAGEGPGGIGADVAVLVGVAAGWGAGVAAEGV